MAAAAPTAVHATTIDDFDVGQVRLGSCFECPLSQSAPKHTPNRWHHTLAQVLGSGTYATVLLAKRRADGQLVAIKALKKAGPSVSPDDVLRMREVRALSQLAGHPNVLRLIEVRRAECEGLLARYLTLSHLTHVTSLHLASQVLREKDGRIYFVLEHAQHGDLYGWIRRRQEAAAAAAKASTPCFLPTAAVVRRVMRPLLAALSHMHGYGFCHRDVKVRTLT